MKKIYHRHVLQRLTEEETSPSTSSDSSPSVDTNDEQQTNSPLVKTNDFPDLTDLRLFDLARLPASILKDLAIEPTASEYSLDSPGDENNCQLQETQRRN